MTRLDLRLAQTWRRSRRLRFPLALVSIAGILIPAGSSASTSYTYDPLGRLTTAIYDNGLCLAYTYDANGNRTSQTGTISGAPKTPVWGTGVWGCMPWTSP